MGSDDENFYLYRTRLDPALDPGGGDAGGLAPGGRGGLRPGGWRLQRSRAGGRGSCWPIPPTPGEPLVTLWSADSTYAVVLRDRARAPSLASVRELSRGGSGTRGRLPTSGEVWINELRLGGGSGIRGVLPGPLNLELVRGADLLRLSLTHRGRSSGAEPRRPATCTIRRCPEHHLSVLDRFTPEGGAGGGPSTVESVGRGRGKGPPFLDRSDNPGGPPRGWFLRGRPGPTHPVTLASKRTPTGNCPAGIFLMDWTPVWATGMSAPAPSPPNHLPLGGCRCGLPADPGPRTIPILPDAVLGLHRPPPPDALQARLEDVRIPVEPGAGSPSPAPT